MLHAQLRIAFVAAGLMFRPVAGEGAPRDLEQTPGAALPRHLVSQPELPPCTCRAAGRVFEMGETTCLDTPSGPRQAICAMDQNVTSWRPTANACPSASRSAHRL